MDKKEILQKAKLEQIDEGLNQAELNGYKLGFYISSFVYAVISIFSLVFAFTKHGQMMEFYVASSMYYSFMGTIEYKKYKFVGDKKLKKKFLSYMITSFLFFLVWFLRVL